MHRTAALLALVSVPALAHAEAPDLFVVNEGRAVLAVHPHELRTLERIEFPLPSGDVELDLRLLSERGASSYTLVGSVPGMPLLHAMITVEGPAIVARLWHPDLGAYAFSHTDLAGGRYVEVEPPALPACGCDCASHDASTKRPTLAQDRVGKGAASAAPVETTSVQRGFELCRDSAAQIDVLFIYTQSALDAAGSVVQLEAEMQMAIDTFNLACQNSTPSGIVPFAQIVHSALADDPAGTTNSGALLDRLQTVGDGFIDEAHVLRDAYNADLVLYINDTLDVCGRAYISVLPGNSPRPDLAFGVLSYTCMNTPLFTTAHEMGHILGALHDFDDDYCDTGSRAYSHAYAAADESFQTIMTTSTSFPRIPYFSERTVMFMGQPVGEAGVAENMFAMNLGAALEVGRYRLSDCNGNNNCDDRDIALGMVDDLDGNGVPDACQRDEDANGIIDDLEIMNTPSLDTDADGMLDSVEQPVRYVDQNATGLGTGLSWADAHTSIHDALDAAERSGGDITDVWIASGTYKPTSSSEQRAVAFAPPSNISIYGGFAGTENDPSQRDIDANPTVLSGDLVGQDTPGIFAGHRDNSLTILRLSSVTGVVIDGITFYGGYADTKSNCGFFNYGGAISSFKSGYTLRRCTFTGCGANNGGAIGSIDQSVPRLYDCDFIGNTVVPVDFKTAAGDIVVRDGVGAAVSMTHSPDPINNGVIIGCRFLGNTVGSALVNLGGAPLIVNSLFADNEVDGPMAAIDNSSVNGSDATIINSTIVNNTSSTNAAGIGIGNFRGDVTIINTIVYGNRANGTNNANTQVSTAGGGTTTIRNSLLEFADPMQFATTYVNVQDLDPLFVDAMGGDFTLDTTSPAIDAGDTSALDGMMIDTDLAGEGRFVDDPSVADTGIASVTDPMRPIVDIGALERPVENDCAYDVNNTGSVDIVDFTAFAGAFNTSVGDPNYDPALDFNGTGSIDIVDFTRFAEEFGRSDCL